ncbi:MAG: glycosyltransferase family 39 protein [Acidobacteriota bacterium]|nr:glycosyltransferase family 39 protein [Acidobacteriota bacterium]MDQ5871360.1 glycosyltransferase family 39 protein [Acidobacteriota bacterium]
MGDRQTDGRSNHARLSSRIWASRGFLGGVAAVVLAVVAQWALVGGRSSPASWGYLLAILILLAVLLRPGSKFASLASPANAPSTAGSVEPLSRSKRSALFPVGLTAGLLLVGGASAQVWARPDDRQTLPALFWAAGLVVVVLASRGRGELGGSARLLPGPDDDAFAPGVPRLRRSHEVLLATAMLVLAAVLRFADLDNHPGIFGDEGERGLEARAIAEGRPVPFFGYGWWGVPNLYFYSVAALLRLLGDGLIALRMLSVLSGVAAVFFVYGIGRLLFGARAGLLAGTFLAVSPLALQFSRLAGESTPTGALWAGGFFFLFRCLRFGRYRDSILAGISFGLSLYFYPSGKLLVVLLPALGMYLLLVSRRRLAMLARFGFLCLGFFLTVLPYGVASHRDDWKAFTGRYRERSIFSEANRAEAFRSANLDFDASRQTESLTRSLARDPFSWGRVFVSQMRRSLEVLYRRGDPTVFYSIREHAGSMLSPLMAALTLLGLAYATARIGDLRFGVLSLWFWGGLLGAALTLDTPSVQRLTGAWPAVMLFPAILLDRVFASSWPLGVRFSRRWSSVPLLGLLAYVGSDGIREYFVYYRSLAPYGDATAQARYAEALGNEYKAYQLGVGGTNEPEVYFGYGSTRFLARGVEGGDVAILSNALPVTDNGGKGIAFLVYPWNADYLPILQSFYPGGKEDVIASTDGIPRFRSYKLGADVMRKLQALRATYRQPNGETVERVEPNLGTLRAQGTWNPPPGLRYPALATWEGRIVAPTYGRYTFLLAGSGAGLSIDGSEALGSKSSLAASPRRAELILAKGLHDVRLTAPLQNGDARIPVTFAFESEKPQPIEPRFLSRGRAGGLSGEVWTNRDQATSSPPEKIAPTVWRIDPAFGIREAMNDPSFGQRPFVARWRGSIQVESEGKYLFETRSNGSCRLAVDGRTVLEAPSAGSSTGSIELERGLHPIELSYQFREGRARLELFWTPPSGERGLVPPTVLFPERRSWRPGESELPSTDRRRPSSVSN